jgi:hypothetical protein
MMMLGLHQAFRRLANEDLTVIEGSCLCGAVRWTFAGQPDGATACNCTACRRYGVLWAYDYENEGIHVSGGCIAFWRGKQTDERGRRRVAVNLRLAEPDAVAEIPIDHFDGLNTFDDLPRDGRCVSDYWF